MLFAIPFPMIDPVLVQVGPLAIVAASDRSFGQAKTFAAAATARRPLAIFRELHLARQWLDAQLLPDD